MNDDAKENPAAAPPDRARWEENLTKWQQVEAGFAQDPAEGLRLAERLLIELSGVPGGSPTRIVREFTWKREYPLGSEMPATDPNPLVALTELGRGFRESVRLVQQAQAAARGMSAARERRTASREDFQQAMELCRAAISQILGVNREHLEALGAGAEPGGTGNGLPQTEGSVADDVRERIIAEKLVRESMIPLEEAASRAERWRTARWATVQFAGSLVVGLVMLAVVIWVLSL